MLQPSAASMAVVSDRVCSGPRAPRTHDKEDRRQGAWREREDMRRSATTAYRERKRRTSPKKTTPTAPKRPKRPAAKKANLAAPKRVTRAFPKRATRAAPKKTRQSSVAAMQAQIDALRAEVREARDQQTADRKSVV